MPKKIDSQIVNAIKARVAAGECRSRLALEFGVSKSTVIGWTKDVPFVDYQSPEKKAERARGQNSLAGLSAAQLQSRASKISRAMKAHRESHPESMTAALAARQAVYTDLELTYKPFLESIFGELTHQCLGGKWFDFVNDSVIIETTEDWGKGVTSATNRFRLVVDDPRTKLLFCQAYNVGEKRLARLTSLGVDVLDIEDIRRGSLGPKLNGRKNVSRPRAMVHGTLTCYKHCKCELCRAANREHSRNYKRTVSLRV